MVPPPMWGGTRWGERKGRAQAKAETSVVRGAHAEGGGAEDEEAEGVALAVVEEGVHGLHGGVVGGGGAGGGGAVGHAHAAGGVEDELDVGHLAAGLGLLELAGAGEEEDGEGEKEVGESGGGVQEEGEEAGMAGFPGLVVEGEGKGAGVEAPLEDGEGQGEEKKGEEVGAGEGSREESC